MKTRNLFLFVLLVSAAFSLNAQTIVLTWVDGDVSVIQGSTNEMANIGDVVSLNAQLHIGQGSTVELDAAGTRILLSTPGTFTIRRFVNADIGEEPQGVLSTLSRRVRNLNNAQATAETNSAIAGVRASNAVQEEISWVTGDTTELFEEGFDLLASGELQEAYYAFEEAYFLANDREIDEASFYLGYAAVMLGDLEDGLELFQEAHFTPENESLFSLYTLSTSDVYLKMGNFQEALETVNVLFDLPGISQADLQLAHYYGAMAHGGLGNTDRKLSELRQVIDINANPQLTAIAEEILWSEE